MARKKDDNQEHNLQLSFITFSDEKSLKDPTQQQQARTQAIKNSLQRKRRQLQLSAQNFVDETPQSISRRSKKRDKGHDSDVSEVPRFRGGDVDPFDSLRIDANRLTRLLRHVSARQAGDPVFSMNDVVDFQGLQSVFNAGLQDPALTSALCLTLAFAANGGVMNDECSSYRLQAIQSVNAKLSDPAEAASTTTMGTILLLVGVEGRLGERDTAQIHLNGTRQLLVLCDQRKAYLSHAMKRAIFWQDLFTAMLCGTERVFSHDTFPEMHWHRDPFQQSLYSTPVGFLRRADILGEDFLDIAGDICALQRMREGDEKYPFNSVEVEKVDNQQAWIESRLQQLQARTTAEPLLQCCIPAAFICGYGFYTEIWADSLIPSNLATHLLQVLQHHEHWTGWDEHTDLLLWLLNLGVAFASDPSARLGFIGLWHGSHRTRLQPLTRSWDSIERQLQDFIWSSNLHSPKGEAFWEKMQNV